MGNLSDENKMTWRKELDKLESEDRLRRLSLPQGWIDFSGNDYLNLSRHESVIEAAQQAIAKYGTGSRGSRLMSGNQPLHEELERALAERLGYESALVFGSGFLANLGLLTSLLKKGDACFADRLNHASLVDGMRHSGAKFYRYEHNNIDALRQLLKKSPVEGRRVVVTDSVFSMDGDFSFVPEVVQVAREHDAIAVVDEAHAIGVFGTDGAGICRDLEQDQRPDIITGTLSKALGSYGGFVVCSETVRSLLVNRARGFIYSTGLPPACAAAALESLRIIKDEQQQGMFHLGDQLMNKAATFYDMLDSAGLPLSVFQSQIIPIRVGENGPTVRVANRLREAGVIATAIRPPTVPEGTARLRLSVTLAHTEDDLQKAARFIEKSFREEELL